MITPNLFAVVLAAGSSSRYGSTKQLAPHAGGTLAGQAVRAAESVCGERTVLVTGNSWREVADACAPLQGFLVVNPDYREGLSISIRAGIHSIAGTADAVLLTLADQPLVTAAHLAELACRWRESPDSIIASGYADTVGPPVIFPRDCFSALSALQGDRGAKPVLEDNADRVITIRFDPAAADIDRPEDLRKIQEDAADG